MAHSANIISKININNTLYEIHDAEAIHELADLGLTGYLQFKGAVATVDDLPSTGNNGDIYHVVDVDSEYIWVSDNSPSVAGHWEEFGSKIMTEHKHSIPALSGSATVTGTNAASSVSGSATVTGTNAASAVSGSCSVTVPKVSKTANYIKMSTGDDTFVKSYPGATSKMVTTSITPAGSAVSVINSVTPSTGSVTGVSGSTTASKATAGTAIAVAKAGTAVSIPNVTGNSSVTATKISSYGSASTWNFTVEDGILTVAGANGIAPSGSDVTASNTTLGTAISVTPAVSNGNITPYTFENVTVPKAAVSATTVVTGVSTDSTNVATVGSAVTVATGSLASTGSGASVMTGLGTASTAKALTSASFAEGTSTDGTLVGDTVEISTETKTGTISGTAAAQTWTQDTGTISGTAAAQTWTQKTGSVATTASNTGNVQSL